MMQLSEKCLSFIERRIDFPVRAPLILTNISVAVRHKRIYAAVAAGDHFMCADGIFRPTPPGTPEIGLFSRMEVFLAHLDDDFNIVSTNEMRMPAENIPKIEGPTYRGYRGWDSPRLFVWLDRLFLSPCIMGTGARPEAAIYLAEIGEDGAPYYERVERMKPILPYPTYAEKNWMPDTTDPHALRFHYRLGTLAYADGTLWHPGGRADLAQLNGGSQVIPYEGGGLAVVHGFHNTGTALRRYFHFFVRFNAAGSPLTISAPFTLTGRQVEIVTGLAYHPDGKRLMLSYGRMDADPTMPHQEFPFIATIDFDDLRRVL